MQNKLKNRWNDISASMPKKTSHVYVLRDRRIHKSLNNSVLYTSCQLTDLEATLVGSKSTIAS